MKRTCRIGKTALFALTMALSAPAGAAELIIDNLTGGSSSHQSCIDQEWSKHEWDIIFPAEYRNQTLVDPVLYYRAGTDVANTIDGSFVPGDEGGPLLTPVYATLNLSFTPPLTNQIGNYYVFDFTGQSLDIPANGELWFRFDAHSGADDCNQNRDDIGALGTYTTTYQQNDFTRPGGTSFAIVTGEVTGRSPALPVPALTTWSLLILALGVLGIALRRRSLSAPSE